MSAKAMKHQRPVVTFIHGLQQSGGLSATDIANFTAVSKATVSRWTNDHKTPKPGTELAISDLYYLTMRLSEFYSPGEIRTWWYARHPQLAGERAIDLIRDNRSSEVLEIINRLEMDVYL